MGDLTSGFSVSRMMRFVGGMLVCVMCISFFVPGIGIHIPGTSFLIFSLRGTGLGDRTASTIATFRSPNDLALADDAGLTKILRKLTAMKAASGDAVQANKVLHVAVLDTKTSFGANERAPTVNLDFGEAGGAAVLLLTRGPIAFQATHAVAGQRAKIAVEGRFAFDLDAPPGLLHDFDIVSYGAGSTYGADAFAKRDDSNVRYGLCGMLKRWSKDYGVEESNVRIWYFAAPTQIAIRESGLSTNVWSQMAMTDVQMLCHPPTGNKSNGVTITIRR